MGQAKRLGAGIVAAGACLAAVAGVWLVLSAPDRSGTASGGERATIQHVVDGDTVYVLLGGQRTKVRLLNVDAPEIPHPGKPGECYGQEAAAYLAQKLPAGSEVELEFDVERFDRYDRTLAGVTYKGEFVNETLVASGHATAMKVEPNDKFYGAMRAAQKKAERANAGMFDPANGCR